MQVNARYIFSILLVLANAGIGCGGHYDPKDCRPQKKFKINGTSSSSYNFQAYTKEDPLTLHITFQDLNKYLNNDRIVLSNNSTVYQLREGRIKSNPMDVALPMAGWQAFKLSLNGSVLHINDYTINLDYPIGIISIIGRYLTLCSDGTPMWHIDDEHGTIIPIQSSKSQRTQLKLSSLKEFEPYIDTTEETNSDNIKKVKRSLNNPTTMTKNEDYMLIILEDKMFLKNKDGINVISKQFLVQPSELLVSSRKGDFNITLLLNQPYQGPEQEWQDHEIQLEPRASSSHESQNAPTTALIVMAVITTLSLTICMAAIIIILRAKKRSDSGHAHNGGLKDLTQEEIVSIDVNTKTYNYSYQPI